MWLNHVGQASPASLSDGLQPVQYPLQQGQVGSVASMDRPVDHDQVLIGHVADQDADDAERKVEVGGHLGDGQDVVAESGDGPLLHGQLRRLLPDGGGADQRSISRSSWVGRVRPPVMA
jgi:hypothetical protein